MGWYYVESALEFSRLNFPKPLQRVCHPVLTWEGDYNHTTYVHIMHTDWGHKSWDGGYSRALLRPDNRHRGSSSQPENPLLFENEFGGNSPALPRICDCLSSAWCGKTGSLGPWGMRDRERAGWRWRRRRRTAAVVVWSWALVWCGLADITAEPERGREKERKTLMDDLWPVRTLKK